MIRKIYRILIVLILMGASFGVGYWLHLSAVQQPAENNGVLSKLMDSSLVQSWTASLYGSITAISGRTVSLSFNNEVLSVPIADNATFSKLTFSGPATEASSTDYTETKIGFGDLAVGQNVSIITQISKDGTLSGLNVAVVETPSNK